MIKIEELEELEGLTFNELLLKCIKLIIENNELNKRINKAIDILECSNNMFSERGLEILKGCENNERI